MPIQHDRHNRHSYYLIKNAELLGFDAVEIEVIALAARGHRKQGAQYDSIELHALSASNRRLVRSLAAILRIADALDRSHFGVVEDIETRYSPGRLTIEAITGQGNGDLSGGRVSGGPICWRSYSTVALFCGSIDVSLDQGMLEGMTHG